MNLSKWIFKGQRFSIFPELFKNIFFLNIIWLLALLLCEPFSRWEQLSQRWKWGKWCFDVIWKIKNKIWPRWEDSLPGCSGEEGGGVFCHEKAKLWIERAQDEEWIGTSRNWILINRWNLEHTFCLTGQNKRISRHFCRPRKKTTDITTIFTLISANTKVTHITVIQI